MPVEGWRTPALERDGKESPALHVYRYWKPSASKHVGRAARACHDIHGLFRDAEDLSIALPSILFAAARPKPASGKRRSSAAAAGSTAPKASPATRKGLLAAAGVHGTRATGF